MKKMAPLSTINDHGITSKSAFIILKNITFFGHEKQQLANQRLEQY